MKEKSKHVEKLEKVIKAVSDAQKVLQARDKIKSIQKKYTDRNALYPSKEEQRMMIKITCESAITADKSYSKAYKRMVESYPHEILNGDGSNNYLTRDEVKEVFDEAYNNLKGNE